MKSKKAMIIAVLAAALAAIIGIAVEAEAAGTPEQAACFLGTPTLATQWQVSSDYFSGIYAPEQSYVKQSYTFSGNRSRSDYRNPMKLKMSLRGVNGHRVTKAMACYEVYSWVQMVDEFGAPLYSPDGSPAIMPVIVSASWRSVNPANMLVFSNRGEPQIGSTFYSMAAWAVGGEK